MLLSLSVLVCFVVATTDAGKVDPIHRTVNADFSRFLTLFAARRQSFGLDQPHASLISPPGLGKSLADASTGA